MRMKRAHKLRMKPQPAVPRGVVVDGQVTALSEDGTAQVTTESGASLDARLPQHVDVRWLRAALAVAPVECTVALTGRHAILWCLLPGEEHAEVEVNLVIAAPHVTLRAREGVQVVCGRSSLKLDAEGKVQLRGKDVLSRASHSNRIKGGIIRLN